MVFVYYEGRIPQWQKWPRSGKVILRCLLSPPSLTQALGDHQMGVRTGEFGRGVEAAPASGCSTPFSMPCPQADTTPSLFLK